MGGVNSYFCSKLIYKRKKMYRIITTIAVAFATITAVNAQEFKVGAKAGLLFPTVSNIKTTFTNSEGITAIEYKTGFKTGFHFGGFIEYGFNDHLFVEGGIDYSFQGAKVKSLEATTIDNNGKIDIQKEDIQKGKWNTQQLNIPLWVKYDIAGFRPKVGVNLGYLTKIEIKGEGDNQKEETQSLPPKKRFDFGLGLGAEYNLPFGLFFDATFNLGLTNLSNESKTELDNQGRVSSFRPSAEFKNRVIQIGVGYKF